MSRRIAGCGLLLAASLAAAGPDPGFIETWNAGASAWTDRDAGELAVFFDAAGNPGGSLRGEFAASQFPLPEADSFRATAGSSGGAFTGDYRSKFALVAGWRFDFRAETVKPSGLTVRFGDGTNEFFRSGTAQVTATGVWQSVFMPLEGQAGWSGPPAEFSNALFQVQFVEVEIVRNGALEQRFFLDNFELVRLAPYALAGDPASITWADLKAGATYEVQTATNLFGAWSPAGALVATNGISSWSVPADPTRFRFHRLVLTNAAM